MLSVDDRPQGLDMRLLAARRLQRVLSGAPFDPLTVTDVADERDRAFANRLVTLALRRHGHIDLVIAQLMRKGVPGQSGLFGPLLRIGLAELLYAGSASDHAAIFTAVEAVKTDRRARRHGA